MPDPESVGGHPHPFLLSSLDSIIFNGYKNYEILIGIDGDRPWLMSYLLWWSRVNNVNKNKLKIFTYPYSKTYGNFQRNKLIEEAKGDVLCFLDQDDAFKKNALSLIATKAKNHPGHPLFFKMAVYMFGNHSAPTIRPKILWNRKQKEIAHAAIGGHMIVVPNNKELLGKWPHHKYDADFYFIKDTCNLFLAKGYSPIWINYILSEIRPWSRYLVNYTDELKITNSNLLVESNYKELNNKIKEKEELINQLLKSNSWKITKPLRFLRKAIAKFLLKK